MSNFEVESPQSILDLIHLELIKAMYGADTKKRIVRGGQRTRRPEKPLVVYDVIWEDSYKSHQVMKKYSTYLGQTSVEYKLPMKFVYQYTLVFDSGDSSCSQVIQNLTRYLVSDRFKNFMNGIYVYFNVLTEIKENNIPLDGFSDRQFQFNIRYDWADIWTDSDAGAAIESIETVETSQTTIPDGG